MLSTQSHLGLLDSIVRSAERLWESELCCLEYRRKVSTLYLLRKIYHRVGHSTNEYLNYFLQLQLVLGELALVILRSKTDQFPARFCASVEFATVGRT